MKAEIYSRRIGAIPLDREQEVSMSSIAQPSATFDAVVRPLARQTGSSARSKQQAPAVVSPSALIAAASAPTLTTLRPTWLERLAAWAEAQPAHRRMGSWTLDAACVKASGR
jgi:hypothetical protein